MTEAIVVALISGGLTLAGVIVSNNKHQAIMDTKMEELTREVPQRRGVRLWSSCISDCPTC